MADDEKKQLDIEFHVSQQLDYLYRDVFNVYVSAADVVIEFGNRHRPMPEHATISNRIVLSVPNAYVLIQTLNAALQDQQAKLQRALEKNAGKQS